MDAEYYRIIDSTNDELKRRIKSEKIENTASVYSFEQQKGRGRNGRGFISQYGGLYYSIAFRMMDIPITALSSLAVVEAIKSIFDLSCQIKWVNDIIYNKKKCAGILAESTGEYAVLGIGIDVYNKIPTELQYKAINLKDGIIDENALHTLAGQLDCNIKRIINGQYDANWLSEYTKYSAILGCECTISVPDGDEIFTGVAKGFDENANLIIQNQNESRLFSSGELSLKCDELYRKCLN